ncbi:hypothetical protein [Streptosporangium saharense]|uniref:Secreted protein n=1 Tax=Streptosporangium saharense TaxID=1706840 RepID=A0A7W7QS43_9ACTN|nr:hypothetical protein [Streptosporangium saharense]MBB4918726.1 hypothetical protein [Streptosporangium saharense]
MFYKRGAALLLAFTVVTVAGVQSAAYADNGPDSGSKQAVSDPAPVSKGDSPGGADASLLAATVTCGSGGVSDPETLGVAGTNLAGSHYNSNGTSDLYVKVATTRSGTTYGWTKDVYYNPAVNEQITTGWWDNSGNPHWCGWNGNQYRTVLSTDGAYTSAVRKDQATYIRGHVNPYDFENGKHLGWQYGPKVPF